MKNTPTNKFPIKTILMFFMLGFFATPTFANTGPTHWNLDSIFGHSESSEDIEEHYSEWPTQEQPGDPIRVCDSSVDTMEMEVEDHDSEWPTEEQPDS